LKQDRFLMVLFAGFAVLMVLCPELALAQFSGGGALESKVNGVTSGLINFLLPAASVIGLIYSAILAATGDASAKARMTTIAICSVVGMLAPLIIRWLQGMVN
jgi:hypothetical protein